MMPSDPISDSVSKAKTSASVDDPAQDPVQLQAMKAHLDLVLLALEALAQISSDDVLQAAQVLGLGDVLGDRITLWRWRQSSPLRRGKGGRKKLDLDEARAMTLICAHLAGRYQPQIRQAVTALENFSRTKRPLYQAPLIGDYLDSFYTFYQERIHSNDQESPEPLHKPAPQTPTKTTTKNATKPVTKSVTDDGTETLALKLLIDLWFYSVPLGAKRLWSALLERSLTAKT
jgi:hypothetical protein